MTDRSSAYKAAGVDIEAGNAFVNSIKSLVGSTNTKGVMTSIGGFGGLFKPDITDMHEPVLVAATDGVGTKLKLAFTFDRHDTVGIDLVAMNANDVLVQGARPLFFLDYLATGRLDQQRLVQVVSGISEGCRQAKCALLGGETAEMPDFYNPGEYDLAGFCVGLVDNPRLVDGAGVNHGDVIIGLAASGLHSNGYSLVRKVLAQSGLKGSDTFPGSSETVADVLLRPTKIYVQPVLNLLRDLPIKAMAHITGGGFYDNIPRVLPAGVRAEIRFGSWPMLPEFTWLKESAGLSWQEMLQIFNCSIGYILVVDEAMAEETLFRLEAQKQPAWIIGHMRARQDTAEQVEILF